MARLHLQFGCLHTVDEDAITQHPHSDVARALGIDHGVRGAVAVVILEAAVLDQQGDVVGVAGELIVGLELDAEIILEDEDARQAVVHLLPGLAVGVGVEPQGGGGLIQIQDRGETAPRGDGVVRATIHIGGNAEAMPMDGGLLGELVVDVHRHRIAAAGGDEGRELAAVVTQHVHGHIQGGVVVAQ